MSNIDKNDRILVIGAAGFLGQHIVSAITDSGMTAVGLDLRGPLPGQEGINWVIGNASDENLISRAARDCNHVIFLGGSNRPTVSQASLVDEIETEVIGPVRTAEICSELGVRRFIFASSGGTVYGPTEEFPTMEGTLTLPTNFYGYTKLMVEHALRLIANKTDMSSVTLRITNPYGPGQMVKNNQGFISAAMAAAFSGETLPIWGDGSIIRDFIYVGDVARAFVCALAYGGRYLAVNISSGVGRSLLQICEEIKLVTGRQLNIAFEPGRRIDLPVSVLSNELALKELCWGVEISLRDGLQETADWWQNVSVVR